MIRRSKKGEDNYSDTLLYNKTLEHVLPQKWEKNWLNVPCYDRADDGQWLEIVEYEEVFKQIWFYCNYIWNMYVFRNSISNTHKKCYF